MHATILRFDDALNPEGMTNGQVYISHEFDIPNPSKPKRGYDRVLICAVFNLNLLKLAFI
jgi:hypothetical protein